MHDAAVGAEIRALHREAGLLIVELASLEEARTHAERGSADYARLTRQIIALLGRIQEILALSRLAHTRARAADGRA
jgi:hypothetical protein